MSMNAQECRRLAAEMQKKRCVLTYDEGIAAIAALSTAADAQEQMTEQQMDTQVEVELLNAECAALRESKFSEGKRLQAECARLQARCVALREALDAFGYHDVDEGGKHWRGRGRYKPARDCQGCIFDRLRETALAGEEPSELRRRNQSMIAPPPAEREHERRKR